MKYIITERQYKIISEEVSPRLKDIIFNKLLNDMKNAEIIEDNDDIWAIDPDEKYWYFQLKKDGTLWWRWDFFNDFFRLFSLERKEYEPLIRDMVENILNRKVGTSYNPSHVPSKTVEDILNRKVGTSSGHDQRLTMSIKDILNRRDKITKDEETEGSGAYAAPAFQMKPDHITFKHQYKDKNF